MTTSPLVYIETTFAYDALNRLISKSYNDSTPDVLYKYDAQPLAAGAPGTTIFQRGESTGRLVSVTYGGTAAGNYYGYDGLGRVVKKVQQTDGVNYQVDATYNRAGAMVTQTYPVETGATRRVVTHTFDGAGRLRSLSTAGASVTNIGYAAHGALSSENYGTLLHQINYNSRLQPTAIELGTGPDDPTSKLNLTYTYGTTNNNGNVQSAAISIETEKWTQTFTYDALNRIDVAKETKGGVTQWSQSFEYDRYGNRWQVVGGIPSLTFNPANNRITSAGYSYDLAGNLTAEPDSEGNLKHSYAYDAENHIKSVDGAAAYVYDGEGQRVRKLLGESLRMIYGIGGELLAEFDLASGALKKEYIYRASGLVATIASGEGTRYITADHLGSPRIITSTSGAVISRHDYEPFGEELFEGMGDRTTAQGYSKPDDTLRQKFTGKERDIETGLDYFSTRYYASAQGRFTSIDPYNVNMECMYAEDDREASAILIKFIGNPQHWNPYLYVLNNPLKYIDPTGETEEIVAKVNIVYDKNSIKDEQTARNMTAGAVADATKVYATAGIKLEVTYTAGTATGKGATAEGRSINEGKVEGAANIFIQIDRTQWTGGASNAGTGEAFIVWGQGRDGSILNPFAAYTNTSPGDDIISHELGHLFGVSDNPSRLPSLAGDAIDYGYNTLSDIEINSTNSSLRQGVTTQVTPHRYGVVGVIAGARREIPAIATYRVGAKRYSPR